MDVGPIRPRESISENIREERSISDSDFAISGIFERVISGVLSASPESAVTSVSISVGISPVDLDQLARPDRGGLGLGYKSANLIQLQKIALHIGVEVPFFLAFGHTEMMAHISKVYPEFTEDYKNFLDMLGNPPILSELANYKLIEIQDRIKSAFTGANTFQSEELKDWVDRCESEYVAVRSTGKEDSATNSNAGGNLSNPFVTKELFEISKNIGEVIASYFSEKSILQRISSDDTTLLTDRDPFVPVLIQAAVAESIQGDTDESLVPRSMVLLAKGDISEASVCLGHASGVTEGVVPCDTYRFVQNDAIQEVVVDKATRIRGGLGPDGKVVCHPVRCSREMAIKPALSSTMAARLQHIANEIYVSYGMEMDVEMTIIGNKIFLLQARPLITPVSLEPPSFLADFEEAIEGEAVTVGGSHVRVIAEDQNIIVCKTIKEAYDKFKKYNKTERAQIQGVIIHSKPPRASHEAVFFTMKGLPVIFCHTEMTLTPPYLLDPQQGLVAKKGTITNGSVCYPIPLQYSMKASKLVEMMNIPEKRGEILIGLQEVKKRMGPPLGPMIRSIADLRACVDAIKSSNPDESKIAFSQIVYFVHEKMVNQDITPKTRIELLMILENIMDIRENAHLSDPLYTARLVEACLFQTGVGIIGGFSLVRSLGAIKSQRAGSKELSAPHVEETLKDILFVKMGRQLLQEGLKATWQQILLQLPMISTEEKNRVKSLFHILDSMGSGAEFVNVILARLIKKHEANAPALFEELIQLSHELEPTLVKAHQMHRFVEDVRAHISAWSDSEHIRKSLPGLVQRLHDIRFTLGKGSIANVFHHASPDARLILIQAIREVVTVYDDVIKSCTSSTEYKSQITQTEDLLLLLRPYQEMMKVIEVLAGVVHSSSYDARSYSLPDSLHHMTEDDAVALREVNPGFDVSQIIESDRIEYTQGAPVPARTFEEKFTLFHKTMESHLSTLIVQGGFSITILPEELQDFIRVLATREYLPDKQLTSIKIEGDLITTEFMIPLRQHGAKLILTYNKMYKKIKMNLSMYGGNEDSRWNEMHKLADEVSLYTGMRVRSAIISATGMSLYFDIMPLIEDSAITMSKLLGGLFDYSFTHNVNILQILPERLQTTGLILQQVQANYRNLQYVRPSLLTPEIIEAALQVNPGAIEFIPIDLQTEDMVLQMIRRGSSLFQFVKPDLLNKDVIKEAILKNVNAFKNVPQIFQTPEMVLSVVQKNGMLLKFVKTDLMSKELVLAAVNQNIQAFKFVPYYLQTEEMVLQVIKLDPFLLKFVNPDFIRMGRVFEALIAVVREKGAIIQFIPHELMTPEIVETALKSNISPFQFIPYNLQTKEMILRILENHLLSLLKFASPDLISKQILIKVFQADERAIRYLPEELLTPEIITMALQINLDVFKFMPAEFQTEEMVLEIIKKRKDFLRFVRSDLINPKVMLAANHAFEES